jgi:ABC-type transport system substrate-binding protein
MNRRSLLLGAATLAAPGIARAQGSNILRFTPPAAINILDPVHGATLLTRVHSLMVYDTLYGIDDNWVPQPQMAEGHVLEDSGRTWRITLRDGLRFHDTTPVLARDVVASLQRWGKRDVMGQTLLDLTDELSAPSDRVVLWRLKRPFPLLPEALGKMNNTIAAILPERIARTDAFTAITDHTGSGPFRYVAAERVEGARSVYARAETYTPRTSGTPSLMAGPKVVHFDRVEWTIMPDPSTAANALGKGEIDWWQAPSADLLPLLRRNPALKLDVLDRSGMVGVVIDAWRKIGMTVDYVPLATSIIDARLGNKGSPAEGGWHAFASSNTGYAASTPVANNFLRGTGDRAIFGWPNIPRIEELRDAYMAAPDLAAQQAICRDVQQVAFDTLPYLPTGMWLQPTAYRTNLTDIRRGFPQFYGVRRT